MVEGLARQLRLCGFDAGDIPWAGLHWGDWCRLQGRLAAGSLRREGLPT